MKKLIIILLVILCTAYSILNTEYSFAQSSSEHIENFNADITIEQSGEINVIETIEYDFGSDQRHGIFRNIPFVKENADGNKLKMDIDINSVTNESGTSYQYKESLMTNEVNLKIGDPDSTITGLNTYVISYSVKGALTYFSDHDELYWNITGLDWNVPITQTKATIHLPGVINDTYQFKCFTGGSESKEEDCKVNQSDSSVIYTTHRALSAYENLTIVAGFPINLVEHLEPKPIVGFLDTLFGKFVALILFMAGLIWYIIYPIWIAYKWYHFGRDPNVGPAPTSYFESPKVKNGRDLTPSETGTLIDETVHLKDVLATIIDLARRGHLTIVENKKNDFSLRKSDKALQKENITDMPNFEVKLLTELFKDKNEIRLKDADIISTVKEAEDMIYEGLVNLNFFPKNPKSIRTYYQVIGSIAIFMFNLPLAFSAFLFGTAMPRKTLYGAQEANKAKGLLSFIKSQESHFEFIQGKNIDAQFSKQFIFERFLPYAVAFGVEKKWMERFKDFKLVQPEWYNTYRTGNLTYGDMTKGLQSSFSSFRSAATPTHSSSGYSSGFSGGGSSGGGGGGGGGGSW